ncbi:MAG: hypothetical protein ACR2GJ_08125 [Gemmatimonadaceae bacterium]
MRVNTWTIAIIDLLAQQAAALPDTIFTKEIARDRSWWDQATSIASGVLTLTFLALAAALIPAALNVRKTHKKISDTLDRIYGDINPLMRHASSITDNLDYITTSIRVDVQQVNQTVASANQKLLKAAELAEDRLDELNALLEVAQEELEAVFIASVSTIKGVGTGAATFARGRTRKVRRERLRDPGLVEAVERVGDALDESFADESSDEEEFDNGGIFRDQGADGRPETPRIRPRG